MLIRYDGVSVFAGERALLDALDLEVGSGELLGLVGPNGSGKSTALRCLYRGLTPDRGTISLHGVASTEHDPLVHARTVAALPQAAAIDLDYTVAEVVALGRYPHGYRGGPLRNEHSRAVNAAIAQCDLSDLRDRPITRLSGGERQRTLLARALAVEAEVLVLDEPTNHLDIRHQLALFGHLRHRQITTIAALHDLNLAAMACTRLAVLESGRLVASGPPADVLAQPDLLSTVFGVDAEFTPGPATSPGHLRFILPAPQPNPAPPSQYQRSKQ